jgi:GST-like protein
MLYLAEKFEAFVPMQGQERAECLSWLFWQIGSAPYMGLHAPKRQLADEY